MINFGQICNTAGYFWHPSNPNKKYPGTLDFRGGSVKIYALTILHAIPLKPLPQLGFHRDC